MNNKEILRYLDLFGTKCSFYTEQKLKLYTPLGGILSIISFITGIFIFIYTNISSFKRKEPKIITSSIIEGHQKIKLKNEKIWIPWRILEHNLNDFNFSGILFPIIKYYYRENKNEELKSKEISYKFCNETSMINESDNVLIDSSLDNLFCIDMDDLYMGGSFSTNYLYYIEFGLYICRNGMIYNETNSNCISFNRLKDYNNHLQIIFYFPTIHFQECELESPVKIKYHKNYSILSTNILKIDKLFLHKIVLYDILGMFSHKEKKYSFWGISSINRDIYYLENMKNGTTSKIYSFEIFIESNSIIYTRSYKDLFVILAQSLPLMALVYNLLKLIAKLFKSSSINRKMTELLFENLTEKPDKFENFLEEIKAKKNLSSKFENNNVISITNNSKSLQNHSSLTFFKYKDKEYEKEDIKENDESKAIKNKDIVTNKKNEKNEELINSLINYKRMSMKFKEPYFHKKKRFVANKLFPFRYYFWAVFAKNIDLTKNRFFLSKKFIKVYCFLCQLFDISSYCVLQKEFNVMKNSLFDEKNIDLIEKAGKINVNGQSFMRDMSEAIENNKFSILGKNIKKKDEGNRRIYKDKNKI